MIKYYFCLALRNLISQGDKSLIGAYGLVMALSCAILKLSDIQYELNMANTKKMLLKYIELPIENLAAILLKKPVLLFYPNL